jgi:hypothetical protein
MSQYNSTLSTITFKAADNIVDLIIKWLLTLLLLTGPRVALRCNPKTANARTPCAVHGKHDIVNILNRKSVCRLGIQTGSINFNFWMWDVTESRSVMRKTRGFAAFQKLRERWVDQTSLNKNSVCCFKFEFFPQSQS